MQAYDRRAVGDDGGLEDLGGRDNRGAQTPLGNEVDADQAVLAVEHQNMELLAIGVGIKLRAREFERLSGIAEALPAAEKRTVTY